MKNKMFFIVLFFIASSTSAFCGVLVSPDTSVGQGSSTFSANYSNNTINATYAVGQYRGTYTCARSAAAPASYISSLGTLVITTTADVPRYSYGYFDDTGLHYFDIHGILMESSGTNLALHSSGLSEAATWTVSNITVSADSATSPDGSSNAETLSSTSDNSTILQSVVSASSTKVFSIFLKRATGSGAISLTIDNGATWTSVLLTSDWARFYVSATIENPVVGIKITTTGDEIYAWGGQLETGYSPTSYIPTTTASLTRPTDRLYYAVSGNRTASSETLAMRFIPLRVAADYSANLYLTDSSLISRRIRFNGTNISFSPNATNSVSSSVSGTLSITIFVPHSIIATCQASSPYASLYVDTNTANNESSDSFTVNNWGSYFYVGGSPSAGSSILLQKIAIYSDVKTQNDINIIINALEQ